MKKLTIIIVALIAGIHAYAQPFDCRATCKSQGLTIQAWIKPFTQAVTWPNGTGIQLIIVFSLPANGATNTTNAPMPVSATTPIGSGTPTLTTLFVANDRYNYSYQYLTNTAPATTWPVNSENLAMTLTFGNNASGIFPRLDNLITGQGPGGANYFYFEINSVPRSDTEGDPFYNGLEGTYPSTDQYVQATAPLPIRLISFDVEKEGERSAYLSWSSSSEINSSHFEIQRSFDKKVWNHIGIVAAAGNSQIVQQYNFYDDNVYNGKDVSLNVYYRLKMVDIDERSEFSPMESVTFGKATYVGKDILAYPNPASDGIQVEWDASQVDQPTAIEIYDIAGKLIYQTKVTDQTNQYYIDFGPTNIQTGLHLMRIMHGDVAIEHKQIVVSRN